MGGSLASLQSKKSELSRGGWESDPTQHSLLRFLIFTAPVAVGTRWEQGEEMRAGPKFLTFGNGQHGAALQSMLSDLFLAVLVSNCRTSSSRSRSAIFLSEEFSQPVIYSRIILQQGRRNSAVNNSSHLTSLDAR